MEFPCEFSLKIFCAVTVDLEPTIIAALRANNVGIEQVKVSMRASSGGKYNAYTAAFPAESQEQLDNIYRELSSNPEVIMVL
jgi:putative lipoic acid-binding regulatory protein